MSYPRIVPIPHWGEGAHRLAHPTPQHGLWEDMIMSTASKTNAERKARKSQYVSPALCVLSTLEVPAVSTAMVLGQSGCAEGRSRQGADGRVVRKQRLQTSGLEDARVEAQTTRVAGAVAGNLWTALQRPRRMG